MSTLKSPRTTNAYDKAWWAMLITMITVGALKLWIAWALAFLLCFLLGWMSYRYDLARIREAIKEAEQKEQKDSHD